MTGSHWLFDRCAGLYDRLWIPTHADLLRERLAGVGGPVVDVGGGTGRFTASIAGDRRALVLDLSPGMLARARNRGLPAVRGDGARAPLADDSVGAVTVTEAFHHVEDQAGFLAEAARVLRPDGVLLIEEIDPRRTLGRLVEVGENLVLRFGSRFRTPAELIDLARDRFDDVGTEPTGALTYLVEAREPGSR